MGARLTTDSEPTQRFERDTYREIPYGVRPTVPERPVVALDAPTGHPEMDVQHPLAPFTGQLIRTPTGLSLVTRATAGPPSNPYGMPSVASAVRGRVLPAVPAPQDVCVVGGFDPGWGTPPSVVRGLPVHFDSGIGAYAFDPAYSHARKNVDADLLARQFYDQQRSRWKDQHLALQPYKRPGSDEWVYRWIPNVRAVSCFDSERALRAHQQAALSPPAPAYPGEGTHSGDTVGRPASSDYLTLR